MMSRAVARDGAAAVTVRYWRSLELYQLKMKPCVTAL